MLKSSAGGGRVENKTPYVVPVDRQPWTMFRRIARAQQPGWMCVSVLDPQGP